MTTTTVVTSTGNTVIVEDLQQQVIVGGYLGPQGVQGVQGYPGIPGDFAGQGVQGYQGPQGLQGVQGLQGRQGLQGSQGLQGLQGTQGLQGLAVNWLGPYNNAVIYRKNDAVYYNGSSFIYINQYPSQNEYPEYPGTTTTNSLYWNRMVQGTQGVQGAQGLPGGLGPQGAGGYGPAGPQGIRGPIGYRGGVPYQWSTSVTANDPGTGRVRFNSTNLLDVTEVYFDIVDYTGINQESWIESWNQTQNPIKGHLVFQAAESIGGAIAVFGVVATEDQGDWYKVDVNYLSGTWYGGVIDLNDITSVLFIPAGDQGVGGIQGIQGVQGRNLTWRGNYSSTGSYGLNDSVSYNGSTFVAIQSVPQGQAPELNLGVLNSSYWTLSSAQGTQGVQGLQGLQGTQGTQVANILNQAANQAMATQQAGVNAQNAALTGAVSGGTDAVNALLRSWAGTSSVTPAAQQYYNTQYAGLGNTGDYGLVW